ncbi:hypothetical protein KIW84_054825 [Lathyrus oleraceus]|uniref:NBS-LRR type disease resistance protein n=1 Tax=Pisum sativum TaxID=3888 RepID=A0A9D5AHY4_PEA|nr:hypothetical protein KIW84_054825 [Pisum sativum]
MAEMAVSLVIDQLLPLLREEAKLLRGIHKEFADIKDELESIQAFLKDADKRAATTEGDNTSEGVKTWVKQVREATFRIEDIIDDYLIQVAQQAHDTGCVALIYKLKTMIPRHRIASEIQDVKSYICGIKGIASEIQDVKSYICGIKERSEIYAFQRCLEQRSSSSRESQNSKWFDPRVAALYIEESEVVGFEVPRKRLIDWMINGRDERTVFSVVGMRGQGKTTLAKKVFDNKEVIRHFNCRVWITVSQSYNVEELLRDILIKLRNNASRDFSQMNRGSLTEEVRKYLQQKRYSDLTMVDVRPKIMVRQLVAEGFVKEEKGKTLEEVAEGYLTELIHRSLVQVSSLRIDGKVKRFHVHDLIRDMILEKIEDLNFCKHISDDGQSSLSGIIRRLSVTATSYDVILHIERSHVRSLIIFSNYALSPFSYFGRSHATFRLLKVLDYERATIFRVPNGVGSLIHLKYLSFNYIRDGKIPKSIGMLQNLETLDARQAFIKLPKEICKLRKLRHLISYRISLINLKKGIGEMTSLQMLRYVHLDMDGAAEVIKELGKLKQMRDLGLVNIHEVDGSILSSSINEMQHLEKLNVLYSFKGNKSIDLDLISAPTMLRKLSLVGRLDKLPEWIPELQNLVALRLGCPI